VAAMLLARARSIVVHLIIAGQHIAPVRAIGALNLSHADFAATRKLLGDEILALQTGLADPDGDGLSTAAEQYYRAAC